MDAIREFQGPYRFLSSFYPAEVLLSFRFENERQMFRMPAVENAYQAAKIDPNHPERLAWTRQMLYRTAGEAKRAGRKLPLRSDWEKIRLEVMYRLVKQKFSIPRLREQLLETGDLELIEGNSWGDRFWGVDLKTGQGENFLGKTLMRVREELRSALASEPEKALLDLGDL